MWALGVSWVQVAVKSQRSHADRPGCVTCVCWCVAAPAIPLRSMMMRWCCARCWSMTPLRGSKVSRAAGRRDCQDSRLLRRRGNAAELW